MSLHPAVLAELLHDEADVARQRLGKRIEWITVHGDNVDAAFVGPNAVRSIIRLGCCDFDAEPPKLFVVNERGDLLPPELWPTSLNAGPHPSLHRPWTCVQGTYEYHTHISHTNDGWGLYRPELRISETLSHLLEKCGQ